ncbi:MAG: nitroreductase family protein [Desulfovibrionaceae bacterium]
MSDTTHPVLAAIRQRRSIRTFTPAALTEDEITAILEAGVWAPSGLNNQPWKFLVVRTGDPRKEILAGLTKYTHILNGADTLFCVFLDKERMYNPLKDHQVAGAAIQNMLLAVHALGLGAVWIGEIINRPDEVMDAIGVDKEQYEFMAVLAVGHPDQKGSSSRRELESFLMEAR